jgi:uncharacterized protein
MPDFLETYRPPFFLFNAHLETIYPALFRRVSIKTYTRERIDTPDNDFLDLDWLTRGSKKLVVIQHGLEGNSYRAYIKGMAKTFYEAGYDVLAWNYRGCSQEMNRQLRFYHSGATEDLHVVIERAKQNEYEEINLVGFSLGGNITLKYLGEKKDVSSIKRAVVFSVPVHLEGSCRKISQPSNRIYAKRFLDSLKLKILAKSKLMTGLDTNNLFKIKSLIEFDDAYTSQLHGFHDAIDYYTKCSSLYFIKDISIPTLIVNTLNDPFLSKECFPVSEFRNHPTVKFEIPERGGHVGFAQINKNGVYWSEQRALHWITNNPTPAERI